MAIANLHFNPLFLSGGRFSSVAQSGNDAHWIIGQSNPIGRDSIRSGIDDDYTAIAGRVFQFGFNSQTITAATNPLDHADEHAGDMGLWLEFTKTLMPTLHSSRNQLVVPCALGGSSFSGNNWNPGDSHYNSALASLAAAMGSGSGTNRLCSAIWIMGETDADNGLATANAHSGNMQVMYDHMLENAVGLTESTPFLVGSIKPDKPRASIINAGLQTFAANNAAVQYIDLTDLSFFDEHHYDAASLAIAGQRFASALL